MRTSVQKEIVSLESDPTYVKAGQRLKTVEQPKFLRIKPSLGFGQIVETDRQDADQFVLGGVGPQPIIDFDNLVKEKAVNEKIVEGYESRLKALKARISELDKDLKNT